MLFPNILLIKLGNSAVLGHLKSHWLRILLFLMPVFCSCEWSNTLKLSYITDNCILPYHFSIHLNLSPLRRRQYVPLKHQNIYPIYGPQHKRRPFHESIGHPPWLCGGKKKVFMFAYNMSSQTWLLHMIHSPQIKSNKQPISFKHQLFTLTLVLNVLRYPYHW